MIRWDYKVELSYNLIEKHTVGYIPNCKLQHCFQMSVLQPERKKNKSLRAYILLTYVVHNSTQ